MKSEAEYGHLLYDQTFLNMKGKNEKKLLYTIIKQNFKIIRRLK